MRHQAVIVVVLAVALVAAGHAQAPVAARFEIASIRPTRLDWPMDNADQAAWMGIARRWVGPAKGGRFAYPVMPAVGLVQMAYDVWGHQIQGAPAWARSARFAIDFRAGDDIPLEQMRPMLRTLLAERFNLVVRREVRTAPVFELVPADGGLRFAAMKEGGCITRGSDSPEPALLPLPSPMPNICGWGRRVIVSQTPQRIEQIEGVGVPMSNLIQRLEPEVGRIIIDRTGFTGRFSYRVAFVPGDVSLEPPNGQVSAVPIGDALKEQLGLKLRSTQGEVDALIIERIERPTAN